MKNTNKKIKKIKKKALNFFVLMFTPHIIICAGILPLVTNPAHVLKYQLYWFLTYTTITLFAYIFAKKIIR